VRKKHSACLACPVSRNVRSPCFSQYMLGKSLLCMIRLDFAGKIIHTDGFPSRFSKEETDASDCDALLSKAVKRKAS